MCAVDINNNLESIIASPCMVIHAMAHSSMGNTFIKMGYIVSLEIFEA